MIKPVELLRQPDERFTHTAGGFDTRGNPRPLEIEDLYDLVRRLEFGPAVPDAIRREFDNARHAFIYSWFVYDLATLAESHSYGVLEKALEFRAQREGRSARRGLRKRLDDAVTWVWLDEKQYEVQSPNGKPGSQLDFLCRLRNDLAHGNTHLVPSGSLQVMNLCYEIISTLFPG